MASETHWLWCWHPPPCCPSPDLVWTFKTEKERPFPLLFVLLKIQLFIPCPSTTRVDVDLRILDLLKSQALCDNWTCKLWCSDLVLVQGFKTVWEYIPCHYPVPLAWRVVLCLFYHLAKFYCCLFYMIVALLTCSSLFYVHKHRGICSWSLSIIPLHCCLQDGIWGFLLLPYLYLSWYSLLILSMVV